MNQYIADTMAAVQLHWGLADTEDIEAVIRKVVEDCAKTVEGLKRTEDMGSDAARDNRILDGVAKAIREMLL